MEPLNSSLSVPPSPTTSQLPAPTPPPTSPPPPSLSQSNKRKCDDSLKEVYEIMRSAKKKMEESKDEFEVYGQYVASELKKCKKSKNSITGQILYK